MEIKRREQEEKIEKGGKIENRIGMKRGNGRKRVRRRGKVEGGK